MCLIRTNWWVHDSAHLWCPASGSGVMPHTHVAIFTPHTLDTVPAHKLMPKLARELCNGCQRVVLASTFAAAVLLAQLTKHTAQRIAEALGSKRKHTCMNKLHYAHHSPAIRNTLYNRHTHRTLAI